MPNPSKAPRKRRFGLGRYQFGIVVQKRNPLKAKYPVGTKVTLQREALAQDFPPITGTVKGYDNNKKLLIAFPNQRGLTAVKPNQLRPHYRIGSKPVALKVAPIK